MTSQVEDGSELAALQQAAELEASEQKRVAEKLWNEANSVLKAKREKRGVEGGRGNR